jgi:hypothetical protein
MISVLDSIDSDGHATDRVERQEKVGRGDSCAHRVVPQIDAVRKALFVGLPRRPAGPQRPLPDAENFGGELSSRTKFHFAPASRVTSFDHLVGAREQRGRNLNADRLRGLEVHHELELGGQLHWKIDWLRAS